MAFLAESWEKHSIDITEQTGTCGTGEFSVFKGVTCYASRALTAASEASSVAFGALGNLSWRFSVSINTVA